MGRWRKSSIPPGERATPGKSVTPRSCSVTFGRKKSPEWAGEITAKAKEIEKEHAVVRWEDTPPARR